MQRLLSLLLLTGCAVGLQVLIMMKGWGLQPHSWWWIIGGGVFGVTVIRSMTDAVEKEHEKGKTREAKKNL